MTWTFHIDAAGTRRVLSRVLQVLDSQMVQMREFAAEFKEDRVLIKATVSSQHDSGYRIEALLHRLEDVRHVVLTDCPEFPKQNSAKPTDR